MLCTDELGIDVHAYCKWNDITPRLMYDVSPNTRWNVLYELGEFWNGNDKLKEMCADNLNSSWFSNSGLDVEQNDEFVNEHIGYSATLMTSTSIGAIVIMLIAFVAIVMLRWYGSDLRQKRVSESNIYGAI